VLGATTTTYASTPGGPLAQKVGSGVAEYLLRDLHGDVVGLVGSSSTTPAARAYYSPWGEPTWSAAAPALGFQSQRTDSATGQVDMTTRNYVPGLGRFVAPDALFGELTAPLSLNGFAYVQANPVTMSDPLGLFGCDEDQKCQSRPPCRPWPACSGAGADPGPGGVTTSTSSSDTSSDAETVAFPYPSIYVPFSDPMPAPGGWDLCAQAIAVVGGTLAPYSSGCQPGPRTGDIIDRQAPPIGEQVACFSCGRSEDERLAGPCGDATKVASCLGTGVGVALGVLGGLGRLGCAVGLGSTGFSSDCGGPKGPDVVYSKESPQDVIAPGGKLIGKSWKKPGVRTLPGGSI
jgi:RHS repeat-associated protein